MTQSYEVVRNVPTRLRASQWMTSGTRSMGDWADAAIRSQARSQDARRGARLLERVSLSNERFLDSAFGLRSG